MLQRLAQPATARRAADRQRRQRAAEKQERYRQRRAAGRGSLHLHDVDLIAAAFVLEQLGLLPPGAEHERKAIARALSRQIADWLDGWMICKNR